MKKMTMVCLLAGLLNACSQGGGSNNSGGASKYHESYHLSLNGCDTGTHDFGSNVSYEDMQKQLCTALQDDQVNGSCAEPLRKDYFDQKCPGMTWNPKHTPVKPGQPPTTGGGGDSGSGGNGTTPNTGGGGGGNTNTLNLEQVRAALDHNLVDKYAVVLSLTASEKQIATTLGEDMMSCGVSYLGPMCLGSKETFLSNYYDLLTQPDGKAIFYSEVQLNGMSTPIALLYKLDRFQPTVQVAEVEVSRILKPRAGQPLDQYLKDTTAFSSLLKFSVAADFQAGALKRLQSPRDIRELYHVSAMLLGNGMNMGSYPAALDAVAKAFASHKDLIIGGQNPLYQETIIVLILNQVHLPKSDLMDICEGFVKSSADSLKQIGATVLLNDQPARSELKPLVLAALNHSHWMIRKMAITALSNTQKTTAEENQLLQKIDDSDSDVRAEAIKAAAKISVTDAHLPTAISLSTAKNWEVRVEAAKLLGRINTPQATHSLIGMMDDSDSDVRNQANSLLNQKKLDDSRSDDLKQQMKSTNWEVRRESALLLGKIGSDKATLVLIGNLDDSDADVRTAIVSILSKTTIKDSFIQPLSDMYKATDWEVRRNVSTLLAKNTSGAATKSLIAHMGDADSDVQAAINSALENRTLAGDMVDDLKTQFSNNDWGIRQEVAKLLGKIKTKESLAALEAQLAKETDSDVKTQLEKSIQAVKS